jgi:ribosomal protein L32E
MSKIIYEKLYKEKKNRKTRIETWKAFKLRQSWKNLQNKDSVVRDL